MPGGEERLFLSARSEHREGVAIRGGIPVIFPQFAAEGPLPRHGFARTMRWTLREVADRADGQVAHLELEASEATRAVWPASFVAGLDVHLGDDDITVRLKVKNTGDVPFGFTAALHTYLRVHDIRSAELHGLQGTSYRESAAPGVLKLDAEPVLRVDDEMDRVYVDAPPSLMMREPGRSLEVRSEGFPDVVVWNPGARKAAALADMERGGERRMLCVEAAAVQRPVVLQPGSGPSSSWSGMQVLKVLG